VGAAPRRAALAAAAGGVLLLSGATALPAAAAPAAGTASTVAAVPAAPVPRLDWGPCGEGLEAFQCATAEVPLDHDEPRGATTTIALTRLPASDPQRRIGTLFTNPGGPGGSGVAFVQGSAQAVYTPQVRARFDILGFDPRGVAGSDPATCFASQEEETAALTGALLFPADDVAQERRFVREQTALARACARTSPQRLRHISTANVARDMDLLRRAVGDERLTYAGYSYGTFLGATYARLFPGRVRALVLDGTIEPRAYSGYGDRFRPYSVGARIGQGRGGAQVFEEFLRLCAEAGPEGCSLAALGDPREEAEATLERLQTEPVTLPLPGGTELVVTYDVAVAVTFSSLYSPTDWAGLADLLAGLAVSDTQAAALAASALPAALAAARGEDYPSLGGSLGSTCVDTRTPNPWVYPRLADGQERRNGDIGRYRAWVIYACTALQDLGIRDEDAYKGPWDQPTRAQVLVLGTRFDPATPYDTTRPYASLFRDADVVTLEGWGHTTLGKSRCTDAQVTAYLVAPQRPRGDATCRPDVVPFAPAASVLAGTRSAPVLPAPVRPGL
jgi:pimeloyl-ACP methyl ester carboxylesterase